MNIAENIISEDKDKDTDLSPDDFSVSSNDDQDQSDDLDELSSLFTDGTEVSMQAETSLAKDVNDDSTLEELDALYNSSSEEVTDNSESVADDVSVLQEIEAMYGSSNESTSENNETDSNIEEAISENVSTGDSVLEELEALLSGDSVESVVNSITDEVATLVAAEHSYNESETSGMSALDELKAFLGETASHEDSGSDNTYASNDEYSITGRRSILDELQNLLQSCIDELTAATEGSSVASILSTEVDYPSHYELKNLLETKLSQLMKISAGSASTDHVADGASVLDELSELLGETEINNRENVSDTSVSSGEVDEYVSSIASDYESSNDGIVATDSVLDELKELLGESDDMDTEIPVSTSASDYSMADLSGEIPVPDPLEDLMFGSDEIEDSERLQDSSTESVTDTGKDENEKSVLEEFAAYMDGSSDLPGIGTEASVENISAEDTETESAFDELDSTSDTLEQLEAMLNESSGYTDDEPGEAIPLNGDDSYIEYEAPQLSGNNEEEKHEDTSTLENRMQPDDVKTEGQIQNSLQKAENNNRLPVVGMFLFAVAVIGVIVFWNWSADQDSQANRSQLRQNRSLEKTETVKTKPDFVAQPVIIDTESEPWAQAEVESVDPVLWDNTDNIDDFSATIETAEYETEPTYENEANDSYQNAQYGLNEINDSYGNEQYGSYEEPVQYDVDEPLNNEVIDSGLEMDVLPRQQPEVAYEITEARIVELIVQQIQQVQDKNEKSITFLEESTALLSKRLLEAESSISKLQFTLEEHEHPEYVQPAYLETSKVNDEYQVKQAQHKNEVSIGLLTERLIAAELSIAKLQSALKKAEQLKSAQPAYPVTSTVNAEQQMKQVQGKNEKSFSLLNERVIDTESSISKLQLAVEKYKQLEPVQSVSSITSEMNSAHSSQQTAGDLTEQTYTIWSVHLLSFYGKPPPAGELDFLDVAGVPYIIKRTTVNNAFWYRVLVNNSSEYSIAKEYAEMLKKRLGIEKIWISKKQYTYD